MKNLTGIALKGFPFPNLERIGVLLYPEYPTTILYKTEQQSPLIIEWVDCSEQNIDRFLSYECSTYNLLRYFNGSMSHRNLIQSATKNIIVSFEGEVNNPVNPCMIHFDNLPSEYLPHADVFFNKKEAVQFDRIIGSFNLEIQVDDYKPGYVQQALLAEPSSSYLKKKDDHILP